MSSGEPTRPTSVSAARRSSEPAHDRDGPRRDPAHAHLGREGAREHLRQHRLGRLGRTVRRERGPGLEPGDVLEHDHEPAARGEVGRGGLGDEEAPLRGGAERLVPVGLSHLRDRARREAAAGAVHEHVEAPSSDGRPFDEGTRLLGPRDVAVGAPGRDDVPAGTAQQLGERGAELAGAAGQEGAHPSSDSTTDARLP